MFRLMVMLLSGRNRSCAFDVGIVQLDDFERVKRFVRIALMRRGQSDYKLAASIMRVCGFLMGI